jgi:hypothetical protein
MALGAGLPTTSCPQKFSTHCPLKQMLAGFGQSLVWAQLNSQKSYDPPASGPGINGKVGSGTHVSGHWQTSFEEQIMNSGKTIERFPGK